MPDQKTPEQKTPDTSPAGMMGDGTEEQNLNQPGDPSARITQEEVDEAFKQENKPAPTKPE